MKELLIKIKNQFEIYKRSNFTARIRANQRNKLLAKRKHILAMYERLNNGLITSLEFVETFYDYNFEEQAARDLEIYNVDDIGLDVLEEENNNYQEFTGKLRLSSYYLFTDFVKQFFSEIIGRCILCYDIKNLEAIYPACRHLKLCRPCAIALIERRNLCCLYCRTINTSIEFVFA